MFELPVLDWWNDITLEGNVNVKEATWWSEILKLHRRDSSLERE
jgi:hypothetical protein